MLYDSLIRPVLFRLPSDAVHEWTLRLAGVAADRPALLKALERVAAGLQPDGENSLEVRMAGLRFGGPVGLAAGFDKNARIVGLIRALGFGSMEVGSITAQPSPGNPLPRSFRLPADRSLVNRMGLNNDGAERIMRRLEKVRRGLGKATAWPERPFPIGVNVAKTHDPRILGEKALEDYLRSVSLAFPVADYLTLNVSCPNTSEGKTFEEPDPLNALLGRVMAHRSGSGHGEVPVFVKFSPDLDRPKLLELLSICTDHGVDGYVAGNTSSRREGLVTPEAIWRAMGNGGLSGQAISQASTRLVEWIAEAAPNGTPVIGCGGVFTADDVLEKMRAGATLVQLYTGLVYNGPWVAARIHRELRVRMASKGVGSVRDLLG